MFPLPVFLANRFFISSVFFAITCCCFRLCASYPFIACANAFLSPVYRPIFLNSSACGTLEYDAVDAVLFTLSTAASFLATPTSMAPYVTAESILSACSVIVCAASFDMVLSFSKDRISSFSSFTDIFISSGVCPFAGTTSNGPSIG